MSTVDKGSRVGTSPSGSRGGSTRAGQGVDLTKREFGAVHRGQPDGHRLQRPKEPRPQNDRKTPSRNHARRATVLNALTNVVSIHSAPLEVPCHSEGRLRPKNLAPTPVRSVRADRLRGQILRSQATFRMIRGAKGRPILTTAPARRPRRCGCGRPSAPGRRKSSRRLPRRCGRLRLWRRRLCRPPPTSRTIFNITFGTNPTSIFAPRYRSVWPIWRPKPFASSAVTPRIPSFAKAVFTASSLCGLMTASIICINGLLPDQSSGPPSVNRPGTSRPIPASEGKPSYP